MSDQAQSSTPAAPSSAPGSASERIHVGDNFHEFTEQVQARQKALQQKQQQQPPPPPAAAPSQPPPLPKTVQPTPKQSLEQIQANAAAEAQQLLDPNAPPPGEQQQGQDDQQTQQTQQWSQEDIDLLAKAKAWMASDEIPEEFQTKLVKLKNGEEFEHETFEEVKDGRMRQRDHTRSMQQMKQERQQFAEREKQYQSHFDAVFNDGNDGQDGADAVYEVFTRNGKHKQLDQLYMRMDRERQEDIDGANGMGLATMRRLKLKPGQENDSRVQDAIRKEYADRRARRASEGQTRALQRENERLKQQTQVKQRDDQLQEHYATQRKQLEQLRPRAFANLGLNHDDAVHRQEFDTYLNAIIQQEGANRVTPELVMKAARAAREGVREIERRNSGQPAPGGAPEQQRTFTPQLGGGGKMPGNGKPKQWHAESFAEQFNLPKY